jgi:transmembrane sensor
MKNEQKNIVIIELLTKFFAQEATAEECDAVLEWKNSALENKSEFDAIEKLWNASGLVAQKESIDINGEWNHIKAIIAPVKSKIITLRRFVQIAAAIVVITGLSIIGIKQNQIITQSSTESQLSFIELPDGSVISLNANSKISYSKDFGKTNREITLKGEGYFEVAKNPELPFIIKAREAQIKVVGTKFNVKAYKNQSGIKVTVTEGRVQLSERKQATKKTILQAGETGTYDRKVQTIRKEAVVDNNDMAWKTLKMQFNNTTLGEVAKIISNTYHIDIVVSQKVNNCAITVEFENEDLASVLKVLKSTLDLSIQKDGNKLIISGDGC